MRRAEIIAVGTELLMGQVVNSNATDISRLLAELSIPVYYQSVVGDNTERLLTQLTLASQRSNLIILCGGIGPTHDDLTKQTLAEFLNLSLVQHTASVEKLTCYFKETHQRMPENNLRQTLYFKEGVGLFNHNGFAVGVVLTKQDVTYIVLPGPPHELKMMLEKEVRPYLMAQQENVFHSKTIRFVGIGESKLATIIEDLIMQQTNPTLAIYATPLEVSVRITGNGKTMSECLTKIAPVQTQIEARLRQYIFGYDDETLPYLVIERLKEKDLTLSVAESLTGGWCQKELVDIPGASQCFVGGVVTYHNSVKQNILNVSQETLKQHGAVSEQCAIEMAQQVKKLFQTDIGLSFTGVADSQVVEDKPSGTVYIGVAYDNNKVDCYPLLLHRTRNVNRQQALRYGLNYLLKILEEKYGN